MVYADDDGSLVDAEDIKPRFHASWVHGSDNAEEDDDDIINVWNLRKCSASALDLMSNVYGDEILPTLMPLLECLLAKSGDDAWKEREAVILAFGAVGEGCINGLYPHLPEESIYHTGVTPPGKLPMWKSLIGLRILLSSLSSAGA